MREKNEEIVEKNEQEKVIEETKKQEISNEEEKKVAVAMLEKEKEGEQEVKKEKAENKTSQYQISNKNKRKKRKKVGIIITICIILIILLATFSTIFALFNANKNTILQGISIRNISVEELTIEEAKSLINNQLEQEQKSEIILKVGEETYSITPEQIEVKYNVEDAINKAYNIGRDGNIFENNFAIMKTLSSKNNIELEFTYNENALNNILQGISKKLPNSMADNFYSIEENKLIITRGTAGLQVDLEFAKQQIMNNIKSGKNETIVLKTEHKECPEIDIDKIYSEVKTEPQNATYKTDPYEIIPHKNGIDFDLEEARNIIKEKKDEYIINLIITEPEILTNEIGEEAFPNLLSSFSTKYDQTNRPRSKNLEIAMKKLDGVVVMPGEVCSYNQTLGRRTREAGYEYANGFSGGKVTPMLAGGICQISSTLYDAVLYANLGIVERHNHMFQATYVEPGKDATVVYGSLDFKFENTRKYPIMIKTKIGSGVAEIKIFGIREEVEYEIDIITTVLNYTSYRTVYQDDSSLAPGTQRVSQNGLQGCQSITHRVRKLNGQEVSREVLSKDTYSPLNKIVRRGVASQTTTETQPTEQKEDITPEVPSVPNTPSVPETPTIPDVPSTPDTQTTPDTPSTPDTSTVPDTPSVPDTQTESETTE